MIKIFNKFFQYFEIFKDYDLKIYREADVVIVSNFLNLKQKKDLYFSNIDAQIAKKNFKVLKFYRNFTNINSNKIRCLFKKKNLFISKRSSFFNEAKFLITFIPYYFFTKFYYNNLTIKIGLFSIISHLRLFDQIKDIVSATKTKNLIITVEGHLWEKLIINYCIKKRVNIIGYQFTKINTMSILLLDKKNLPNYIATSGLIDRELLSKHFPKKKLIFLGSAKYTKIEKKKKIFDFLILPNADLKNYKDFKKIIYYLKKKYKLLIRFHPLNYKNFFNNFYEKKIISKNSLYNDLKKSKYILFEESSISKNSFNFNTIPLYFKQLGSGKSNLDKNFPKELIINNYKMIDQYYKKKISKKTFNYLKFNAKHYFKKIKIESLIKILN